MSLSIVGGTSNSFVYDLYTSRFVKRAEVKVKEEATLAPPVLEVTSSLLTSNFLIDFTTPPPSLSYHYPCLTYSFIQDTVNVYDASKLNVAQSIVGQKQNARVHRATALARSASDDSSEEEEEEEDDGDDGGDLSDWDEDVPKLAASKPAPPPPPPAAPMDGKMASSISAIRGGGSARMEEKKKGMKMKEKDYKELDEGGSRRKAPPPAPKKTALSLIATRTSHAITNNNNNNNNNEEALHPDESATPPAEYSMASALDSVEVHAEGKKSEAADLFQYKVFISFLNLIK